MTDVTPAASSRRVWGRIRKKWLYSAISLYLYGALQQFYDENYKKYLFIIQIIFFIKIVKKFFYKKDVILVNYLLKVSVLRPIAI